MILRKKRRGNALQFLLCVQLCASNASLSVAFHPSPAGNRENGATALEYTYRVDDQALLSTDVNSPAVPHTIQGDEVLNAHEDVTTFPVLIDTLEVMQSHYFQIWPGTWPSAIDWTAAVLGTQVSATLSAISDSSAKEVVSTGGGSAITNRERKGHENMINQYFTQVVSFYHGENAFSLRTQAYDDMLWVVLGWLESVKFIHLHSGRLYAPSASLDPESVEDVNTSIWYAQQFIPQFAHRAHVFYDLASRGWDTSLCGGGMVWNPYLAPYKNAITNQLFIAASVAMYLYFPGDDDASPFSSSVHSAKQDGVPPAKAHDMRYLDNAVKAYNWLRKSNMTNAQGLYVDGFHISGWRGGPNGSHGSVHCDLRDDKVYTYNQGVILSGLRGLWDSTGRLQYLQDGHELVRNVINATGWDNRDDPNPWVRYRWAGLGRNGIMEEACDASGSCSQNAQTFKGIWWHHFTIFCAPLADKEIGSNDEAEVLHRMSCNGYGEWVRQNANAAKGTKNENGEYGSWWGEHLWQGRPIEVESPDNEDIDYRNTDVPDDEVWRLPDEDERSKECSDTKIAGVWHANEASSENAKPPDTWNKASQQDLNDRGRGRTVETQSGALAVLRALYKWETWY